MKKLADNNTWKQKKRKIIRLNHITVGSLMVSLIVVVFSTYPSSLTIPDSWGAVFA